MFKKRNFVTEFLTGQIHLSITFTMKIQGVCFLGSSLMHE